MVDTDARLLDLTPKTSVCDLREQMRSALGLDTQADPLAVNTELRERGHTVATNYLNLLGLNSDVIDFLDEPQNVERRQIELIPDSLDIPGDMTELQMGEGEEVSFLIRPSFFGRFQRMIERGFKFNGAEAPEDGSVGVEVGYVFLDSLAYTKQLARRLAWQTRKKTDLNEVLQHMLETGMNSYYNRLRDLGKLQIRDYQMVALFPRLGATIAYAHATDRIVHSLESRPNWSDSYTTASMVENRYRAAAEFGREEGAAPSQADIGMAKPLTIREATRVLSGLSLIAQQASSLAQGAGEQDSGEDVDSASSDERDRS